MRAQKSLSNITAMRHAFQRLMFGEDGAALVEATIIVPILVVMSIYTMDFGLIFYNKMEMQNAAQAGAQWAIANRPFYNSTDIQVAAKNATLLPASAVTVTPSQFCGCSKDSSGNLVVTQLSAGACTTPAPGAACNTSGVAGTYVSVSATPATTYNALVGYGLFSGTNSTPDISATATVRIQ
jgi:Flp pilus assembly protein TadG